MPFIGATAGPASTHLARAGRHWGSGITYAPPSNPTFVSFNHAEAGGAQNSVSLPAPTTITAGNLLVVCALANSTSTSPSFTCTGFTLASQLLSNGSSTGSIAILTKVATGSEPASYTLGGPNGIRGCILNYSSASAIDVGPSYTQALAATATASAQTAVGGKDVYIAVFGGLSAQTFGNVTGMVREFASVSGTGSEYVFDQKLAAAGSVGPASSAQGGGQWSSASLCIK